ncbi:hypothetical protein [Haloferula rosea]|uniref:DUF3108 domain-containing protein n=1 Tax=Haloferula rosea TaxID=490093 RepID=A0A934VGR8_9BACT|nr:hypothetical protein [Haloferula rosea]MBK1827870.1 hypothetical protein [Haloferula rosea]
MKWWIPLLVVALASCSSLTVPGEGKPTAGAREASGILARSAAAHGDPVGSYRVVEVFYAGEWTGVVKRLQPELVDADFRKTSVETYKPRQAVVIQEHRGPGGSKRVERTKEGVKVSYNGTPIGDEPRRDASALVADAYTAFLFGSSWLAENGRDLAVLSPVSLDGQRCLRVQGRLTPGFGFSEEDRFIAWIDEESGLLRRLQFTIDGLESTRGADVDVTFSEFWTAADSSVWPGRFVELVQRPVLVKAHEWWMTGLKADGRTLKSPEKAQ